MTSLKSDVQIETDVRDELIWDPEITSPNIRVAVMDGRVTLQGTVDVYGEKWAAERDALRIVGVRALSNDLTVTPLTIHTHSDADIKQHVTDALVMDWSVPSNRIHVDVHNGWVTLHGTADWYYQHTAAESDARRIAGVTGVDNTITIVQPHVSASDIHAGITKALVRDAEVDADTITVAIDGARVTLRGNVHSWSELNAAKNAAWRAKGVTSVVNEILIQA